MDSNSKQPEQSPVQNGVNIKKVGKPVSEETHTSKAGDFSNSCDQSSNELTDIFLVEPNEYKTSLNTVQMVLDHKHGNKCDKVDDEEEDNVEIEKGKLEISQAKNLSSDQQNSSKITPQTNPELKIFSCNLCSDTFEHLDSLVKHVPLHEKKLQCTTCLQVFPSKRSLTIHLRTHGKKYVCSTCGKPFSSKSDLYWHRALLGKQHTKDDDVRKMQENGVVKKRKLAEGEGGNAEDDACNQYANETEDGSVINAMIETLKARIKPVNVSDLFLSNFLM